jgi:hypothetical protein
MNLSDYSNPEVSLTKEDVIAAGLDIASRATPAQAENHQKVIAWIRTLRGLPSGSAESAYKDLTAEWYQLTVKKNPKGTGRYDLTKILPE